MPCARMCSSTRELAVECGTPCGGRRWRRTSRRGSAGGAAARWRGCSGASRPRDRARSGVATENMPPCGEPPRSTEARSSRCLARARRRGSERLRGRRGDVAREGANAMPFLMSCRATALPGFLGRPVTSMSSGLAMRPPGRNLTSRCLTSRKRIRYRCISQSMVSKAAHPARRANANTFAYGGTT